MHWVGKYHLHCFKRRPIIRCRSRKWPSLRMKSKLRLPQRPQRLRQSQTQSRVFCLMTMMRKMLDIVITVYRSSRDSKSNDTRKPLFADILKLFESLARYAMRTGLVHSNPRILKHKRISCQLAFILCCRLCCMNHKCISLLLSQV